MPPGILFPETTDMATEAKKPVDWERIEADYRAGLLSVREIAAAQGVSHTAIQKKAKSSGWERNLAAKVKAKADALVARREVATQVATETAISERQLIEAGAEAIANVRLAHRSDIRRSRSICNKLLDELEGQTDNQGLLDELGEILRSEDKNGNDRLNDIYQKVISMPGRVDSMKKLSDTLKTLIGLEREAYSIDSVPDETGKAPAGLGHFYGEDE